MITILSGTGRNNYQLSLEIEKEIRSQGARSEIVNLEELDLPLYNPKIEKNGIPGQAEKLSDQLVQSNGFVLVAPEYNGSIPPVVVNAIAWVSRSSDNWREAFNGKVSVLASHSGGGGAKVVSDMRGQLEHLGAIVLPRSIIVNSSKKLNPDSLKDIITQLLKHAQ